MHGNNNNLSSNVSLIKPGKSLGTLSSEKSSLNGKYNILPPLKNRELLNSPRPRPTERNDTLSTSIVVPKPFPENGRYNSQNWSRRETNKDIRESERYIKHIIKQKKDEYKQKNNNFDLLVAKLVNDREKEHKEKIRTKSPKKRSAGRSRTSPGELNRNGSIKPLEPSKRDQLKKKNLEKDDENDINRETPESPNQTSLSLDLESLEKSESKEELDKTPKSERTIRERPKSARYGRRLNTGRPKTGYGSRRAAKEDQQISNEDNGG